MPRAYEACAFIVPLLVIGCRGFLEPALPEGAERFTPPPAYARWWSLAEACSGITRPFGAVRFYQVPNASSILHGTVDAAGYWSSRDNRIVLAGEYIHDGRTVRHEMLHALLRASGHPPTYFRDRCGGVVSCPEVGCRDAGTVPIGAPMDATAIPLETLELRMEVLPGIVSRTDGDGILTLVVRATNPKKESGWVSLEPSPDLHGPWRRGFGFRIVTTEEVPLTELTRTDATGLVTIDSLARVPFAAGQSRIWAIDLPAHRFLPGQYEAVGIYNVRQSWASLQVSP
jgi:hypothetical protein